MGIEKGAVLQEARVFNDPQVDPRKCSQVIATEYYPSYVSSLTFYLVGGH